MIRCLLWWTPDWSLVQAIHCYCAHITFTFVLYDSMLKKKTTSKPTVLSICVIYPPSWWGLMGGLRLWRRQPSDVSCVTLPARRASITGSFAHIHPMAPSSLLPLLCIFGRNVIPVGSQSRTRGIAHQRWHIAWRKRPSRVLPMERREWHLYHHCPLQFVINHANIPKSPILSPFHVWVPDSRLCAGYTREH